jgi:hypothetical protein
MPLTAYANLRGTTVYIPVAIFVEGRMKTLPAIGLLFSVFIIMSKNNAQIYITFQCNKSAHSSPTKSAWRLQLLNQLEGGSLCGFCFRRAEAGVSKTQMPLLFRQLIVVVEGLGNGSIEILSLTRGMPNVVLNTHTHTHTRTLAKGKPVSFDSTEKCPVCDLLLKPIH